MDAVTMLNEAKGLQALGDSETVGNMKVTKNGAGKMYRFEVSMNVP